MRCERLLFVALLAVACTRETPAPSKEDVTPVTTTTSAVKAPPPQRAANYGDAVTWFRSTPGFHFTIEEAGVRAEGDMVRETVGAERVRMTVNGEEWIAEAGAKGVVWKRGGQEAAAPEWGNRIWQRATIAFDPEKREGQAALIEPGHFRFTDANSGAVHDVWVNDANQISKITIGNAMTMTLTQQK
jgi:hypothetical protein